MVYNQFNSLKPKKSDTERSLNLNMRPRRKWLQTGRAPSFQTSCALNRAKFQNWTLGEKVGSRVWNRTKLPHINTSRPCFRVRALATAAKPWSRSALKNAATPAAALVNPANIHITGQAKGRQQNRLQVPGIQTIGCQTGKPGRLPEKVRTTSPDEKPFQKPGTLAF